MVISFNGQIFNYVIVTSAYNRSRGFRTDEIAAGDPGLRSHRLRRSRVRSPRILKRPTAGSGTIERLFATSLFAFPVRVWPT